MIHEFYFLTDSCVERKINDFSYIMLPLENELIRLIFEIRIFKSLYFHQIDKIFAEIEIHT